MTMQDLTRRQLKALVLVGSGVLILLSVEPLNKSLATADSLILAVVNLLVVPGIVLFVVGAYRFVTKGR